MQKQEYMAYETPDFNLYEISIEGAFLTGSFGIEAMSNSADYEDGDFY